MAVLRIATPLIFGTLGVLLCERAGVLNLGIEGIMVAGAFAGWLAVYHGAGLWTGVLVAACPAPSSACCTALLTVPLALSQHVTGLGITLLATSLSYYAYRVNFPKVTLAADYRAVRTDDDHLASDRARRRAQSSVAQTPLTCSRSPSSPSIAYVLYRTPLGLARAHGGREPGGGRGAGHQRHGGAHRRHRRRQRADGRRRRVSDAVGVQRVLLQHGERPRLDLRGAGRVRFLAAGQGAARRDPVRRVRCLQLRLQQSWPAVVPYQLYLMLPYLLSILALALVARRAAYPQALMKPYRKGER